MSLTPQRPLYNFYRRYIWAPADFATWQSSMIGMLRDSMASVLGPALVTGGAGTAGSGLSVNIAAYVAIGPDGYLHVKNTSTTNLAVTSNSSGNPRKDLVVARPLITDASTITRPTSPNDPVPLQELQDTQVVVIAGTPAGSPVYPSKGAQDVILFGITVTNGASAPSSFDTSVTELLSTSTPFAGYFLGLDANHTLSQTALSTQTRATLGGISANVSYPGIGGTGCALASTNSGKAGPGIVGTGGPLNANTTTYLDGGGIGVRGVGGSSTATFAGGGVGVQGEGGAGGSSQYGIGVLGLSSGTSFSNVPTASYKEVGVMGIGATGVYGVALNAASSVGVAALNTRSDGTVMTVTSSPASGGGSTGIQINNADAGGAAAGPALRIAATTQPTGTAQTGDLYVNSSTGKLMIYNGSAWVSVGSQT